MKNKYKIVCELCARYGVKTCPTTTRELDHEYLPRKVVYPVCARCAAQIDYEKGKQESKI